MGNERNKIRAAYKLSVTWTARCIEVDRGRMRGWKIISNKSFAISFVSHPLIVLTSRGRNEFVCDREKTSRRWTLDSSMIHASINYFFPPLRYARLFSAITRALRRRHECPRTCSLTGLRGERNFSRLKNKKKKKRKKKKINKQRNIFTREGWNFKGKLLFL